ncbi:MAG: hypothetical protein IKP71_03810 [Candidatus Riflebacteria bacterium]|jgi:hypothetical protein|nr:hypothetical protein [Candidatus Riflebacteria bacterium]
MKLPDVFASPIDKEINNVQKEFQGTLKEQKESRGETLLNKINKIFADKNFVYKSRVRITTLNESKEYVVVGKTNNSLLSIDGERIKINDILDIERI